MPIALQFLHSHCAMCIFTLYSIQCVVLNVCVQLATVRLLSCLAGMLCAFSHAMYTRHA